MPDLVHRVTPEVAQMIRFGADGSADALADLDRVGTIYAPVEWGAAKSGRAKCRECGELIEKGSAVVRFEYEAIPGVKTVTAFLHDECPS